MRKYLVLLVLLVLLALSAAPALAGGEGYYPPPYHPPHHHYPHYPYYPPLAPPAPDNFGPFYVSGPHTPGGYECAGSLPTQLAVGDTGFIAERFSTLRYYPAGPALHVVYAPAVFEVVAGPVCAGYGPLAWYYIRYDDTYGYGYGEGWASESQLYSIYGNFRYWLLPQ